MSLTRKDFEEVKNGELVTLKLTKEAAEWYEKKLPEGITLDQIKTIDEHNKAMLKDIATDAKDISIEIFGEDKDLKKVVLTVDKFAGNKTINVGIDRLVERGIPGTDEKVHNPEMRIIVEDPYYKVGKTFIKTLTADIKDKLANC